MYGRCAAIDESGRLIGDIGFEFVNERKFNIVHLE